MSKEIITKLDELDNGLRKLSTERKNIIPKVLTAFLYAGEALR